MRKNVQDNMLIVLKENNIFYKIKKFFQRLFYKGINENTDSFKEDNIVKNKKTRNEFVEKLKNVENEEYQLLELQKKYRSGKIKEEELTEKQISALCELYDKQIDNLKKSNYIRKRKLLEKN